MAKVCFKCGIYRPADEFGRAKRNRDGLQIWCKSCMADYREKNREKTRQQDRAKYHRNKNGYLNSWYKRTYGICLDDYNRMLVGQGGVCAICGNTCSSGRRLAVDHNHETGKVRGLLCGHCNTGIGKLKESPALLLKAIVYLKENY